MIKLEIENKHFILFVQSYAICLQTINGDFDSASKNIELIKHIFSKLNRQDMNNMRDMIERTERDNKKQLAFTMNDLGIKSDIEPLIRVVTH